MISFEIIASLSVPVLFIITIVVAIAHPQEEFFELIKSTYSNMK